MTMRQERIRAYRRGILAETLVTILLRLRGHRIVARRYATPVGEIDLVALKGTRLAFIEVKRRRTRDDAAFSVTAKQKRRIVRGPRHRIRRGSGRALELPAHHRQRVPGLAPKRSEAASPSPDSHKIVGLIKAQQQGPALPLGRAHAPLGAW